MKSVLITGASRGIGRATAIRAAQEGWSVAVNYRVDRVAADGTLAAVRDKGVQGVLVPGDVTSEADVASMFREAGSDLGPLTGVVINAGIVAPSLRLAEMDASRIRRMFEVNVIGAYLTAREAARALARSAGGAPVERAARSFSYPPRRPALGHPLNTSTTPVRRPRWTPWLSAWPRSLQRTACG